MVKMLKVASWIVLAGGFLYGVVRGFEVAKVTGADFYLAAAIFWWLGGALLGVLFLALSHILHYLQDIHARLHQHQVDIGSDSSTPSN